MGVMSERDLELKEISREHEDDDKPISAKIPAGHTSPSSPYYDPQRENKLDSLRAYSDIDAEGRSIPLGRSTQTRMAEYIAAGLLPDPDEPDDDDSFEF